MVHYKGNSAKSGIYQIKNLINNKIYIGCAFLLGNRKWRHFKELRLNIHSNSKLQNAFNKYGEENFVFEIIELCEKKILIEREQYYLNTLLHADIEDSYFDKNGYNICRVAKNSAGFKHSEETKIKISKTQMGKKVSQEIKDLLYSYSKGRVVSEETRKKLSMVNKGRKFSNERIKQMRKISSKPITIFDLEQKTYLTFNSHLECATFLNISKMYITYLKRKNKIFRNKYKILNE